MQAGVSPDKFCGFYDAEGDDSLMSSKAAGKRGSLVQSPGDISICGVRARTGLYCSHTPTLYMPQLSAVKEQGLT